MRPKKLIALVIGLLLLATMACSLGGGAKETATPETPAVAPTEAPTQAVPTTAPAPKVELGAIERNEYGGFSFRALPGYDLEHDEDTSVMLAPDADVRGPGLVLLGGEFWEGITAEELLEMFADEDDIETGATTKLNVGNVSGVRAEQSGAGTQGRIAVLMPTPTQGFLMLGRAPAERWAEIEPLFEAVLASVEFFAPIPPEPVSWLDPGWYPYTNPNAARDVVVYDGVVYAATLGGVVLWEVSPTLEEGFPEVYTTLDGLSHVSAHALTVCDVPVPGGGRETRIVVGTQLGLSFYDPMTGNWDTTPITPEEVRLGVSKIDRLYCDAANNRLLIGYSGLGVFDLQTGAWTRYTDKEGLSWNGISDIAVIGKDIWVASGYNGISKISGTQVTVYNEANGLPNQRANALAVGADGSLWVGTSGGLAQFRNNQWKFYASREVSGLADIREMAFTADGALWIGTSSIGGGNLCRFDPAAGACAELFRDTEGVFGMALYHDGTPLFVNNTGLHALIAGEKSTFRVEGNLPATNFVDAFAAAPDGMLWVGTDGGIQRLNPADPDLPWDTFTRADGVGGSSSWATALTVAPDGTVWAAITNGDASRYRDGKWTSFEGLRSYDSVAVDAQGRAWFGDDGKGIVVLNADGSKAMELTQDNGLPSNSVLALLADGDAVWIGTNNGIARYRNGQVEMVIEKETLPHSYVRDLALDADGALLIGATLSIVRYDGAQLEVIFNFQKEGFLNWLNMLAVAPDGTIWAGTQNGVFYFDKSDGTWDQLTTEDGLLSNFITALHVDQFGAVWVGGGSNFSGGGLLHIVP